MHAAARQWVADHSGPAYTVLDIGGRNINGTIRDLFGGSDYLSIDLEPGTGVDVVGDVTTWETDRTFNVVICCEVLEHVEQWRDIVAAAHRLANPGGVLILTAAGPGRDPHSAHDGGPLRDGEWYGNIDPAELTAALAEWSEATVDVCDTDVRAIAVK